MISKRASVPFLCAVFAFCLYRAATQSFTIDESATFLRYVDVPISEAFSAFTANNHVLLTLLMRASRWLLGRSELVLRIPALLGCVLYLTAVYRLTETSIRSNWLRLSALAVLTLNPLVLDLLVAARGYSLALGFSMWALYLAWSDLKEHRPRRLWWAGVCAGLAISANLVFAIPLCVFGLVLIPEYARQRRFWQFVDGYAGPAAVVCFVLLFLPLSKFSSDEFYFGVAKLSETTASLLGESIWQPFGGLFVIDILTQVAPRAREFFIDTFAPGLFVVIGIAAVVVNGTPSKKYGNCASRVRSVNFDFVGGDLGFDEQSSRSSVSDDAHGCIHSSAHRVCRSARRRPCSDSRCVHGVGFSDGFACHAIRQRIARDVF